MVHDVLTKRPGPPLAVKLVHASVGKSARAEPIAMLFESGRVHLHGRFPELERELCGLIAGGGYEGPGSSPDRADAMVWALTQLSGRLGNGGPRMRRV
jgi:phage terminase large subunit-like protein